MSPVSTRLATTSTAIVAATTPALRRLVTRDHDEDGPSLDFRARRRAHLRDATRGGREQLVLHLHRLECGEGRVDVDPITLLDVHGLQETRHRSAQLDPVPSCSDRPATGAECAFVDDNSANIMAVDIEAEWVVRHHRDLVALALEHDRPLAPANGLAHVRRDDAVFDRESAVFTELHADATIVERDLVTHQRSASSRPARAHGPSAGVTARRSFPDRSARTAASAAEAVAPSVRSGVFVGSHRPTNPVSYRPATKSGWNSAARWKGSDVGMPATLISSNARRIRPIASSRSRPYAITFASRESYSLGTVIPEKSAESTRIPGPAGSRTSATRPLAGMNPASGSSAVMRHSMAAPLLEIWSCVNGSGSPAAIRSCSATRSRPVTISVTGCSTCRRVFTSRKLNRPFISTRNSTVPAFTYPARLAMRTAAAPSFARRSAVTLGPGDSSISFW